MRKIIIASFITTAIIGFDGTLVGGGGDRRRLVRAAEVGGVGGRFSEATPATA
jgi:hypothetical protein